MPWRIRFKADLKCRLYLYPYEMFCGVVFWRPLGTTCKTFRNEHFSFSEIYICVRVTQCDERRSETHPLF